MIWVIRGRLRLYNGQRVCVIKLGRRTKAGVFAKFFETKNDFLIKCKQENFCNIAVLKSIPWQSTVGRKVNGSLIFFR